MIPQMKPLLQRHKGNIRVYLQIATEDAKKVTMQLSRDLQVRPVKDLVDDLETLLGSGSVQLMGDGSRRLRRLEQQRLFREDAESAGASDQAGHAAEAMAASDEMDEKDD
jgi:hypothetical protein